MSLKLLAVALAASLLVAGCVGRSATSRTETPASAASGATIPDARFVQSQDGTVDGEIIGTPKPDSKFAKLRIGMTLHAVSELIGPPNDVVSRETGKRWIPFYFGHDAQRIEASYKDEGCLTFSGGNIFASGPNQLIRIAIDNSGTCS